MKILYTIHQFFPRHYTGTERYLLNLAKMMKKFGHEVKVVTYIPSTDLETGLKYQGNLAIKEYIYDDISVIGVRYLGNEDYISFDFENKEILQFFLDLLAKEKPDLLHITHPMRLTPAFGAAHKLKVKIVMTLTDYWVMCGKGILIRNNDTPCMSPKDGLNCKKYCYSHLPLARLEKRVTQGRKMFEQADALIASANFLVKLFELNGYDTSRVNLIRHGFNYFDNFLPVPKLKHKTFTFSCLGSLLPHKGAHLLIKAFKKISNPAARLKIYGEPYQPEYLTFLKELKGSDNRISFEGKYSMKDVFEIHKMSDVIVQPSIWYETYPLIGVASLAYGVPLIVPDTTGASELVTNNENGYIFKFNDEDSLHSVMEEAIQADLKHNKTIFYPHTVEEEAYLTQAVYQHVMKS